MNMKFLLTAMLLLIASFSLSANEIDQLNFTPEELTYIKSIKKRGSFKIATRISPSVYEPQDDGTVVGVWYPLIEQFTNLIDVPIEITILNSMNDFFLQDDTIPSGLKEGTVTPYTPDYLKKVDVYIYTITVKPWRERILRYIAICPTKTMMIIRKGEQFHAYSEIDGKTVSAESNSSQIFYFAALEKNHSISFKYLDIKGVDRFRAVSTGDADISATGAHRALAEIRKYDNLIIYHPMSEISTIGWVVERENSILASILTKYINYSHRNGTFNTLWENYYGMSYLTYLELLGN